MGAEGKIKHDSEGSVPRVVDHLRFSAEQIPDWRTCEAGVVNLVKMKLG